MMVGQADPFSSEECMVATKASRQNIDVTSSGINLIVTYNVIVYCDCDIHKWNYNKFVNQEVLMW